MLHRRNFPPTCSPDIKTQKLSFRTGLPLGNQEASDVRDYAFQLNHPILNDNFSIVKSFNSVNACRILVYIYKESKLITK